MPSGLIKNNSTFELIITSEHVQKRADSVLSLYFPLYSRSFLQQLFAEKQVTIAGKPIAKSRSLKLNDHLSISFPDTKEVDIKPIQHNELDVRILFEHEHFLVVQKPAGLIVHPPHPDSKELSLVDWIVYHYEHIARVGHIDRPGIVHRLDRNTSGIMVIARTNYGRTQLCSLFKERKIHKTYHALVHGHPPKEGTIELAIGRDPHQRKIMKAFNDGALPDAENSVMRRDDSTIRYALTHYKVVKYFATHSFVEFKPVTGRTHQIRVHSLAMGHPLVGDHLYGKLSPLIIGRHALHAASLSFVFDGTEYNFIAEHTHDFKEAIEALSGIESR